MCEEALLKTLVGSPNAIIEMPQHGACQCCGAEDNNRKYFKCPYCGAIHCGICWFPANSMVPHSLLCPTCKQPCPVT